MYWTGDMATRRQQPPKTEPGYCPRCGVAFDEHHYFAVPGNWATKFLAPQCPVKKK